MLSNSSLVVAALGVASVAAKCPSNGSIWFKVETDGALNSGQILDYEALSPFTSILPVHSAAKRTSVYALQLDEDGTLSIDYRDPQGPNSGFFVSIDPAPKDGRSGPPKIRKGVIDLSKTFKPVVSIREAPAEKFKIIESDGEQVLVPQSEKFREWAVCETDYGRHGRDLSILAWTKNSNADYGSICNKVELLVKDCQAADEDGALEL